MGLQLHSFNPGLSPALGLPLSSDALGEEVVVISGGRLDAVRQALAFSRAHTDFLLLNTRGPCRGISFINPTALVGDLELV